MLKILMTAYDINPYKGSESATGWNFVFNASRTNKVIAITRKNNKENIEKYIKENNLSNKNLHFEYFDLPYWMRFWKKKARGSSLYFYLWQMFMPIFVLKKKLDFDIAHNVNFHADAFPTFLWILKKPLIWGPINHNELINSQFLNSKKELIKDRIKWIIKNINWNLDPFMFLAKRYSTIIIGANNSVKKRLGIKDEKFHLLTQVATNIPKDENKELKKFHEIFTVLIVGRFISIKSFDLALKSFEEFYNSLGLEEKDKVSLKIVGDGPLKTFYQDIIKTFNSKNRIEFCGWVEKNEINSYYKDSSIFFFPSHEGAGMVVAEALSYGLPILCFDNCGPGELTTNKCAIKISNCDYENSIKEFTNSLIKLYKNENLLHTMSLEAKKLFNEKYTWEVKSTEINKIYKKLNSSGK